MGAIGSLEYLNLYKTGVTDADLDKLSGLKNSRRSTWQTKVTESKVKPSKTRRPRPATKIFPSTSAWKKISQVRTSLLGLPSNVLAQKNPRVKQQ